MNTSSQDIIQTLKGDVLTEFDDSVWNAVIANVTVFHDVVWCSNSKTEQKSKNNNRAGQKNARLFLCLKIGKNPICKR